MVSEDDDLGARWCSWCLCVGNIELRLKAGTASKMNQCQRVGNVAGLQPVGKPSNFVTQKFQKHV